MKELPYDSVILDHVSTREELEQVLYLLSDFNPPSGQMLVIPAPDMSSGRFDSQTGPWEGADGDMEQVSVSDVAILTNLFFGKRERTN